MEQNVVALVGSNFTVDINFDIFLSLLSFLLGNLLIVLC